MARTKKAPTTTTERKPRERSDYAKAASTLASLARTKNGLEARIEKAERLAATLKDKLAASEKQGEAALALLTAKK